MNNEKEIKEVVELIKGTFNIEELDELERQYNEMYKKLKAENEASGSKSDKDEPTFGHH
jgi:hypothetical protein